MPALIEEESAPYVVRIFCFMAFGHLCTNCVRSPVPSVDRLDSSDSLFRLCHLHLGKSFSFRIFECLVHFPGGSAALHLAPAPLLYRVFLSQMEVQGLIHLILVFRAK